MGRKTVYNKLTDSNKINQVNENNKQLQEDFLDYLKSIDRSDKTIYQYKSDLNIFFVWNLEQNDNKDFVDIKKRELIKFQKYVLNDLNWSPARIKRVKSVISSLSNYIENILDDEYEDFRSIVNKIESPTNEKVREKTVITDDQLKLLLDTLTKEKRYEQACAIAILAYSGMRKAELLQMKEEYFVDDHVGFNGAMYITDKIRTKGRGKQGKQIPKYILIEAKPYIDKWIEERHLLGVDSPFLFVLKENNVWIQRKSIDYWSPYFSGIIGEPFYFHALRHQLCTKMKQKNIPDHVILEFFKWESSSMIDIYSDIEGSDEFIKYFSSNGIIEGKTGKITDL